MIAATRLSALARKPVLAALAAITIALAGLSPAAAQELPARTIIPVDARSGPDTAFPITFNVPANSIVTLMGCASDFTWCLIRHINGEGWVIGPTLVAAANNQALANAAGLGIVNLDAQVVALRAQLFASPQQPQPPQPPQQIAVPQVAVPQPPSPPQPIAIPQPIAVPQQPPGPPAPAVPAADQVCFYLDVNFSGFSFCATMGESNTSLPSPWNNAISSIRVGANAQVEVCGDPNFLGFCQAYVDDVNLTGQRNDAVSSFRTVNIGFQPPAQPPVVQPPVVQPPAQPLPVPSANQICFYSEANFGGAGFCISMGASNTNLTGTWNNAITSLRFGAGASVQVCADPNYGGQCQVYSQNVNLGALNNAISSYRTVGYTVTPPAQPQPPAPSLPPGQVQARASVDVNARSGPGTNFPVQFVVTANTLVTVYECSVQYNWCHFRDAQNRTAWASAQYLLHTGTSQRLLDAGAQLGVPLVAAPPAPTPPPTPQPPAQPTTPAANQVCFYQNTNFGGQSLCVNVGQSSASLTNPWNDSISSIRIGANVQVQVCGGTNYGEWCQTYTDNVSLTSFRNDAISSYRVLSSTPPVQAAQVCVYDGWNYTGASFCLGAGQTFTQMPTGWDNRVSSIRVDSGISIQVCQQASFLGWCEQYTSNTPQLLNDRDNAISSMRTP